MAQQVIDILIRAKDDTKSALTESRKGISGLLEGAKALGPVMLAAGTAAAAGLGYMIKSSIDAADGLSKMSARTGTSVEELSGLKHAADLSGVSMETLEKAMTAANKTMLAAAEGNEEAQRTLADLGVQYKNSDGTLRSTADVMGQAADKLAALEDGAAKNALALRLFGKSGAELIPLLNGGAGALAEMRQEAAALGLEISTGTAKASEAFNDNLSRLGAAGTGLSNVLAAEVAPALANASGWFAETVVASDSWKFAAEQLGGVLRFLVQIVATLGAGAVQTFQTIGKGWGGLMAAIAAAADGEFQEAKNILVQSGNEIAAGWKGIGQIWSEEIPGAGKRGAEALKVANLSAIEETAKARKKAAEEEARERQQALAFLDQVAERYNEVSLTKLQLLELERDAELEKLATIRASEEEKDNAAFEILETFHARKAELEAEEAERKKAEEDRAAAAAITAEEQQIEAQTKLAQAAADEHTKRVKELREMIDYGGALSSSLVAGMKTFTDTSVAGSKKVETALKRIGDTFLQTMLDALIRSAAQAMVSKAADYAATLLFANATAAAWAPAATAATIATVGGAAAQAPVSIGASVAATQGILAVAHGGLDYVPREGTYLLQRGEMVVAPKQNEKLAEFLDRETEAPARPTETTVNVDGRALFKLIHEASADGRLKLSRRALV